MAKTTEITYNMFKIMLNCRALLQYESEKKINRTVTLYRVPVLNDAFLENVVNSRHYEIYN